MNSFDDSTYMAGDPLIIFEDGSDARDFLNYDTRQLTFEVSTNEKSMVGPNRTILRSCDRLNRLLEMNLEVSILANSAPDFVTPVQIDFTVKLYDTVEYQLPEIIDNENNDSSQVFINYLTSE